MFWVDVILQFLVLGPTFWKYHVLYPRYFLPSPPYDFIRWTAPIFFNHCKISLILNLFC